MFGKSSILFPHPNPPGSGMASHHSSSSVSWKSNYDAGIFVSKASVPSGVPFRFGVSHSAHVPRPPCLLSAILFSQLFSDIMRLAYELERLTQFDRIDPPPDSTYVCVRTCVCVPEQVLSSFRLTLLVQTRRTVWRFEPFHLPPPLGFTPTNPTKGSNSAGSKPDIKGEIFPLSWLNKTVYGLINVWKGVAFRERFSN